MKKKTYESIKIDLYKVEEEDVITASAGWLDSDQEKDVVGDDIFED